MLSQIPAYVGTNTPMPNITPITYRDSATLIIRIERLIAHQNELVIFVNRHIDHLNEVFLKQINDMITLINLKIVEINEALAQQTEDVDALLTAQSLANAQAIATAITTLNTNVQNALTQHTTDNTAQINEAIQTLNEAINDFRTEFDTIMSGIASDETSLFRAAMDAVYAANGGLTDADVAVLIADDNSDTQAALDVRYASTYYAGLIDEGRLSVADLNTAYVTIISGALTKAQARELLGITSGVGEPAGGDSGDIYFEITVP